MPEAHVFVSYVREDRERVDHLANALRVAGVEVWVDRDALEPGQFWKDSIRRAIGDGAFFLACFSEAYVARDETYMNEELSLAIERLRLMRRDRAWFIPVLLDDVRIPDRPISNYERLADIHAVRLFGNWDSGISQILKVVTRSSQRGEAPAVPVETGSGDSSEHEQEWFADAQTVWIALELTVSSLSKPWEQKTKMRMVEMTKAYLQQNGFEWDYRALSLASLPFRIFLLNKARRAEDADFNWAFKSLRLLRAEAGAVPKDASRTADGCLAWSLQDG
jgi:TIR domain